MSRPTPEQRRTSVKLIIESTECVFSVDENKCRWNKSDSEAVQEKAYEDYKKLHRWTVTGFTDIIGRFIRVEISDVGADSDHFMYKRSVEYTNSKEFMEDRQNGVADMRNGGGEDLVVRFKRNESTMWMYRMK